MGVSKGDAEDQYPETSTLPRLNKPYWIHGVRSMALLLAFGWFNAIWIYASAYGQEQKSGHLGVIMADNDGGAIGESLIKTCAGISGVNGIASFHQRNMSLDQAFHQVWKGHYWGAIVAMPGATEKFTNAIQTSNTSYDRSTAITYVWNEIRWSTVAEGFITPSMQAAVSGTNSIYMQEYGSKMLANGSLTPEGIQILLNGIQATSDNIRPFSFGPKALLPTAALVFPALLEFFLSMALRAAPMLFGPLNVKQNYLYRISVFMFFSCIMGISWGLWYEAFHKDAGISGGQYCLIWLTFWLYGIIAFFYFDTLTAVAPNFIFPPLVLTYIIINVTSAVFPIDLKPRFYHLDYIWPGLNAWELVMTIISQGSTSRVYRNVPVMFGWIIFWAPLNWLANKKRAKQDIESYLDGKHV